MTSLSYVELHRQFSGEIDAALDAALDGLGPEAESVRKAITGLLHHQQMKYPLSVLPLLVHAVETGDPGPAVPLSAVHLLWWTSACYLDDLADSQATGTPEGLGEQEALLAAVVGGQALPIRIVQAQPVPDAVRGALTAEIVNCWFPAVEGQLRDLRGGTEGAARESVVTAYRGKSGAPFAMITAMAGIWAGADSGRIRLWREFGDVLGILWQLFNDQEDILSGRNEDLRNGTLTYLLACALEEAPPGAREHVLALSGAARSSGRARRELTELLLAPAVLRSYQKDLGTFRDEAYRVLGELGGHEEPLTALRQLVDQSGGLYLRATA
ncbi:polyprenyl synthetase family protein [Streptomyces bluensis]|uniref:polyprenyl synthetase family protein n=1 Tax=Streptomyces bluensis TaxID=33897 RepID=UPI00106682CA